MLEARLGDVLAVRWFGEREPVNFNDGHPVFPINHPGDLSRAHAALLFCLLSSFSTRCVICMPVERLSLLASFLSTLYVSMRTATDLNF